MMIIVIYDSDEDDEHDINNDKSIIFFTNDIYSK
jgi:hypothetical protein